MNGGIMGIILTKLDDLSGPFSFPNRFLIGCHVSLCSCFAMAVFHRKRMYRRVFIALCGFCIETAFQSTKDALYEVSDAFPHGHRPWNRQFFT